MGILPIILHPDRRLKKVCHKVVIDDDAKRFAQAMLTTMYAVAGVGLASPQVGVLQCMFVMDCSDKRDRSQALVLFNPKIIWRSETLDTRQEGCLSLPNLFADVTRSSQVAMRYWDEKGAHHERVFSGLWATCAQHEFDHLNGILFIDHLSRVKRLMLTRKMVKYKREHGSV